MPTCTEEPVARGRRVKLWSMPWRSMLISPPMCLMREGTTPPFLLDQRLQQMFWLNGRMVILFGQILRFQDGFLSLLGKFIESHICYSSRKLGSRIALAGADTSSSRSILSLFSWLDVRNELDDC